MNVNRWISRIFKNQSHTHPERAYNRWAHTYDNQPGNLMLDLDEEIFTGFLNETSLRWRKVVDIGCGTGRHWKKLLEYDPARLVGYDISKKMLARLKKKFPGAETFCSETELLPELEDRDFDFILSTLTLAHIEDLEPSFREWVRVLKPGGEMILTDYHPEALARGAQRTFFHKGRTVTIRNHVHPVQEVRQLGIKFGCKELGFKERIIDESVKNYYEEQQALAVYEEFHGTPIIYGIYFKKNDDPS